MENKVAELEQTDDLSGMQVSSQPLQVHSEKNERNSSDDPSIRHPFTVMSDGRLSESQQGKLHDHSLTEMKGSALTNSPLEVDQGVQDKLQIDENNGESLLYSISFIKILFSVLQLSPLGVELEEDNDSDDALQLSEIKAGIQALDANESVLDQLMWKGCMQDLKLKEKNEADLQSKESKEVHTPIGSEQVQDEQFLSKKTVDVDNVLTLYEEVLKGDSLPTLNQLVNEFRVAGQKGELLGETFVSFNRQTHHKTEFIQFGVPMFEQIKADKTNRFPTRHIEPIPAFLQGLIKQVMEHNIVPKNRTPNGCKIFFFDELESSKIFIKPPHVDPIFTAILSESIMSLGDEIQYNGLGEYRGSLRLSLKSGSIVVMKKEATSIMQAICSSPNKRVTINFFQVHSKNE